MLLDRVFLSARVREFKDVEEFVCGGGAGGWVVRARDDLRGDMVRDRFFGNAAVGCHSFLTSFALR